MMRDDWVEVELRDVGKVVSGGTPKTSNPENWGDEIAWISPADLSGYTQKFISKGKKSITARGLKSSSAKLMPANSVLFSSRAPIGYVAIAQNEVCTNQGFKSIVPFGSVNSEYIYYYLKSIKQQAENKASGTTFKELSAKAFSSLPFPLAPLPEQRAIVAKIEKLFSDLDNGIANLKAAKAKLDIYRQAVLKKAFEEAPNTVKVSLAEINQKIQIGPFGSQLHKEDYIEGGIPLINPMHIQNGTIRPDLSYSISKKKKESLPNYILHEKDVIMGRRGEMGRCALVTNTEDGWFCGTGSLYLRPLKSKVFSPFLYYYMSSPVIKELLSGKATGTTMMNLNKKIISSLPISLPSVQEQKQIVMEIESRLSVCDKLAESIDQSLEKAEALRQSILKKAFEGKLLSHAELEACRREPDWEPAEKLLERINKEKSAGAKTATTGKRSRR